MSFLTLIFPLMIYHYYDYATFDLDTPYTFY